MALAASLPVLALESCLRTKMTTSGLIVVGSKEFTLACWALYPEWMESMCAITQIISFLINFDCISCQVYKLENAWKEVVSLPIDSGSANISN